LSRPCTYLGTERRDILYWNEAERSFWKYVRDEYRSPLVLFEVKNVGALELAHINQTATYLRREAGPARVRRDPEPPI